MFFQMRHTILPYGRCWKGWNRARFFKIVKTQKNQQACTYITLPWRPNPNPNPNINPKLHRILRLNFELRTWKHPSHLAIIQFLYDMIRILDLLTLGHRVITYRGLTSAGKP
jgi:hypothetical protein